MTAILRAPRRLALGAIAFLVTASAGVSFAESYRGLYLWATGHGLSGPWAAIFPAQIDTFIAVGELALFVALADRWSARSRVAAWVVTGVGLAVSIAANVGHVAGHDAASRATAAVPPVAAAAALAVGLGVLKRVVAAHHERAPEGTQTARHAAPGTKVAPVVPEVPMGVLDAAAAAYAASVKGGNALSERALADRFGIPRTQARKVRAGVARDGNGHRDELGELVHAEGSMHGR